MAQEDRTSQGIRVAIIGAGPAGCLLATSLLDAGRARRRVVSVSLYGARQRQDLGTELVLADPRTLSALSAAGLPFPAPRSAIYDRIRFQAGDAALEGKAQWLSLPRTELVSGLRAAAAARGARTVPRQVQALVRATDGSWILRAGGASERADLVFLACGAGAPLAATIANHRAPPIWRCCAADLALSEGLARALEGRLLFIPGAPGLPDLWIIPKEKEARVFALGPDVEAPTLSLALLEASLRGQLPGRFALRRIERLFLPAGSAQPGIPAVGDALGGAPGCSGLGLAANQARTLASIFIDGGLGPLLSSSRAEAEMLGRAYERRTLLQESARPFGLEATERSLRSRGKALPLVVAAAINPDLLGPTPGKLIRLRATLTILWSLLTLFLWRLLDRKAAAVATSPSRLVYLVEDDPDQAALLASHLEERSIPYLHFDNGIEAAAAARHDRPAAILLDIALPWLDGAAICKMLKRRTDVSILLMTSLPPSIAGSSAEDSSADGVLIKPLDLESVMSRLDRCLPPTVEPGDHAHRQHSG